MKKLTFTSWSAILMVGFVFSNPYAFAQTTDPTIPTIPTPALREYHPNWDAIPSLKGASFNYSQIQEGKLISDAAENLYYLNVDHLIVGTTQVPTSNVRFGNNVRGYQVVDPQGRHFILDNIESPTCGVEVIAQQIDGAGNQFGGLSPGLLTDFLQSAMSISAKLTSVVVTNKHLILVFQS